MVNSARARRERLLEAARGYLALDMPDHALEQLTAIENPEKCVFDLCQLRGEALRQKEQYKPALAAYSRALAEKPTDVSILMGMAWCYKRIDQLSRSIAAMQQAYRAAPREPIVLYNLACYFALAGKKSQSLSWLGRALRMEKSLSRLISDESDFDRLRDDPDFQFIAGTHDLSDTR